MAKQIFGIRIGPEQVLNGIAILLVAVTVAGLATLVIFAFSPTLETSKLEEEVIINGSKSMEVNTAIYFSYQGKPALLIRLQTNETLSQGIQAPDGSWWVAFSAECSHENARVEFILDQSNPEKSIIYCPAHDGKFQVRTGDVISGPPPTPLKGIAIEDRGSELWATGYYEPPEHIPSIPLLILVLTIPVIPVIYHVIKEIRGVLASKTEDPAE
ncbi:MAG: ubiquinol-cytochrome c reductase iron-sulfur subunit [Candidatus Hodarchaeota archaeon]